MSVRDLEKLIFLKSRSEKYFKFVSRKTCLSARAYHRIIKLMRTIADLDDKDEILTYFRGFGLSAKDEY